MELNKLKSVICLIYKFSHGNITAYQLVKALYLTDYFSIKFYEKPILGLEFIYHHYGPYPKYAINTLEKENFFKTEFKLSKKGYPTQLKHPCHYPDTNINDEEKRIIYIASCIVKEKSKKGIEELNEFIYSTEPMKAATKGQVIKMHHAFARKRIERIKKRIEDKGLSYYVDFPKGSDKAEREFLKKTDVQFIEDCQV